MDNSFMVDHDVQTKSARIYFNMLKVARVSAKGTWIYPEHRDLVWLPENTLLRQTIAEEENRYINPKLSADENAA